MWRTARIGAAAILALGVAVGGVSTRKAFAADAGPPWAVIATPNTSAPDNQLTAVSCVDASDCWAVGASDDEPGAATTRTLAEHWNGSTWSVVATPNANATRTNLYGVTCVSASDCWAVGGWVASDTSSATLIEHWNGTLWSMVTTTSTGGGHAVSCFSASDCWAVGSPSVSQHWNGSTWSSVRMAEPVLMPSTLVSVSCAAASDCWAVGQFFFNNVWSNLGEHWNGSTWSLANPPSVPGASNGLTGVTCLATSDCWTVGDAADSTGGKTLAEHWDGSSWSIVKTADLPSHNDSLQGVACLSASDCWAIGVSNPAQGLVEHWNGGNWTIDPTPVPGASLQNIFYGLACVSTSDCWAVGAAVAANPSQTPARTLAEHDTTAPTPVVIPRSASVVEGNSGTRIIQVPVTLSNPSPQTVTAQWTTVFVPGAPAGQADPGTDYLPASGTVTFAPGQTTATAPISVKGDTTVETDEYIVVSFTHPTNARMGGFWGLGFGVITNDDH